MPHTLSRIIMIWLLLAGLSMAAPVPPKPDTYVVDGAQMLNASTKAKLESQLERFERETSNQLLVVTFPKLPSDEYLEGYTVRIAHAWGTGQKQQDNGIILFVFRDDRKVRIEVGYGLEAVVPDSVAASIIAHNIAPAFRAGNYSKGLTDAVASLIQAAKGEYKGTGKTLAEQANGKNSGQLWFVLIVVVGFILFVAWSSSGDTVYHKAGREVLRTGWGHGSSGGFGGMGGEGGGGGGGGYSGGGGGFGGGGASGGW